MRNVTALAPWFGGSRMIAHEVGNELSGLRWVGVPFAGGMAELAHIDAPSLLVSDLHKHVINLARVVANDSTRRPLLRALKRIAFHPDELKLTQEVCSRIEPTWAASPDVSLATAYFVTQWMGRSGGTADEFKGGLSSRWNGNGGDSNTRYRSAIRSLAEWCRVMRRCNFNCMDAFDFIVKVDDDPRNGLYIDAPWPDDGDGYKHAFTENDQRRLAEMLGRFEYTRIVIRYGDHPLVRDLYDREENGWTIRKITGRTQANKEKAELLIINGESRVGQHA